jgi:hypothetical protein
MAPEPADRGYFGVTGMVNDYAGGLGNAARSTLSYLIDTEIPQMASDAARFGRGMVQGIVDDPMMAAVDFIPGAGLAMGTYEAEQLRAQALEAEQAGQFDLADSLRAQASSILAISAIPGGRTAKRGANINMAKSASAGQSELRDILQQFQNKPESKLEFQKRALSGDENAIAALMEDKLIDRDTALSQAQASVDRELYRQNYRARKQAERDAEPVIETSQTDDYRGSHEPPDREYGAPLNDLTSMIPSDVYSPAGPRLYGLGDSEVDREAFAALRSARDNPDAEVVVYRAVPEGVSEINSGDWVTTSRKYADMHGENSLGGNYKILEQKAKAGDLFSEGYPYEFGWNPLNINSEVK